MSTLVTCSLADSMSCITRIQVLNASSVINFHDRLFIHAIPLCVCVCVFVTLRLTCTGDEHHEEEILPA